MISCSELEVRSPGRDKYDYHHHRWTHHPELVSPLTICGMTCAAVIVDTVPIAEVAWPALPHLPELLTTLTRRWDDDSPRSAAEWSAMQGGGEAQAGPLPWLAQHK